MIFLFAFLGAVAIVIVVIFSVQNALPVTVAFYNWRFEASLAIVVFLSALAGMVIEVLFVLSLKLRKSVRRKVSNRSRATESTIPPAVDNDKKPE